MRRIEPERTTEAEGKSGRNNIIASADLFSTAEWIDFHPPPALASAPSSSRKRIASSSCTYLWALYRLHFRRTAAPACKHQPLGADAMRHSLATGGVAVRGQYVLGLPRVRASEVCDYGFAPCCRFEKHSLHSTSAAEQAGLLNKRVPRFRGNSILVGDCIERLGLCIVLYTNGVSS